MNRLGAFAQLAALVLLLAALCAIGCICFGLSEGGYAL